MIFVLYSLNWGFLFDNFWGFLFYNLYHVALGHFYIIPKAQKPLILRAFWAHSKTSCYYSYSHGLPSPTLLTTPFNRGIMLQGLCFLPKNGHFPPIPQRPTGSRGKNLPGKNGVLTHCSFIIYRRSTVVLG